MSVYMDELPTACEYCPCCNYDWERCELTGDRLQNDLEHSIADNCKLKLLSDVRENVRGEWIDITAKRKDTGECKEAQQCSVCGAVYLRYYGEEDGFDVVKPNFCPNCGADMRGDNS